MSLVSLPPELLERIALFTASPPGDPRALSHLARTCRALRLVVYPSPLPTASQSSPNGTHEKQEYQNQHLWKLLYLGAFDHPQDAELAQFGLDAHALASVYASPGRKRRSTHLLSHGGGDKIMDWARAYQARIRTGVLLGLYAPPPAPSAHSTTEKRPFTISKSMPHLAPKDVSLVLSSLTSAIHTSSPHSKDVHASGLAPEDPDLALDFGGAFVPSMPSHPLFPPPPPPSSASSDSLNIPWLNSIISNPSSLPLPYTPSKPHNPPLSGLVDDTEQAPAHHPPPFAPSFSHLGPAARDYYNLIAHTGYLFTERTAFSYAMAAEKRRKKKGYLYRGTGLVVRGTSRGPPGQPASDDDNENDQNDAGVGEGAAETGNEDLIPEPPGGHGIGSALEQPIQTTARVWRGGARGPGGSRGGGPGTGTGKGRMPPAPPRSSEHPARRSSGGDKDEDKEENDDDEEKESEEEDTLFLPPVIERTLTRRAARSVVYDMSYLTRRRHWGPFMTVPNAAKSRVPIITSSAPGPGKDKDKGKGKGKEVPQRDSESDGESSWGVPPGRSGAGGSAGGRGGAGVTMGAEEEALIRAQAKHVLASFGLDPESLAEGIEYSKERGSSDSGSSEDDGAGRGPGGDGEPARDQGQDQNVAVPVDPNRENTAAWASESAYPDNMSGPPPSSVASSSQSQDQDRYRGEGSSSTRRHVMPEVHGSEAEALFEMGRGDVDVPMADLDDDADGDDEEDEDERAVAGMGHVLINTAALFGDGEIAFGEDAAGHQNGDGDDDDDDDNAFDPDQEGDDSEDEDDAMPDADSESGTSGSSAPTHPGGILHLRLPLPSPSAGPPPKTEELKADWEWIAAARVVVEANMKEVAGLRQWENWGIENWIELGTGANVDEDLGDGGEIDMDGESDDDAETEDQDQEESSSTSVQATGSASGSDAPNNPDHDGAPAVAPPDANANGPSILAAARARRLLGGLQALASLSGIRPRSAPVTRSEDAPSVGDNAQLQKWLASEESSGVEDWAGVEGVWRRCVCWLDYRDLLTNQAKARSKRYSSPLLGEAVRIIPLALRIVGVDASLAPPQYAANRPALLFEGAAAGPDPHSPLRRTHGVVRMIGDGSIRWSLTSTTETGEDQWTSEAVQLGGVRSRMGVIGMWTGVEHEPADPLGPFWMWKVA